MKKSIWFLIVLLIVASFVIMGCSQPSPTPPPSTTQPPASTTQPPATSKPPASTTTTQPTQTTPASSTPAASGGVIKIGHIRPLTGNMAQTSDIMVKSFDLAFKQVNYQVAGKQIQIITGDSQGLPEKAIDVARKMVENDHVALIVGPTQGGEQSGAAGYMNQAGVPEIFTNPEPARIIQGDHKWIFGFGGGEPQISSSMGVYAYEQLKYRKVDIIAPDTAPGHGFLNAFMATFKKKGGEIAQEIYAPYPTPDFAAYLTSLKPADAVVAWLDGEQSIKFLTQYHEMGIDKRFPLVGAFHGSFLEPFILKALPPADAAATIGDLVPTPYSSLLDTPGNKQFVADMQALLGVLPDDTESGPYEGGKVIIKALQATNGDTTPDKLRAALLAVKFDGLAGPMALDPVSQVTPKYIYICKVVAQGNDFTYSPVFTYKDVPPLGF